MSTGFTRPHRPGLQVLLGCVRASSKYNQSDKTDLKIQIAKR
jgi:hypothetical protein